MNNRWLILAAGCLIQTILGGIYAWSTFVPYLSKDYGLSSGQCGLIFGLAILTFTSTMILAGRVLTQKGPRFTAMIAAGLFTLGYLLASWSAGSFGWMLLALGCVAGGGVGFGYVCPLTIGMKWFPDKKGLVTGVTVSGFGAGAILLAVAAEHVLLKGVGVLVFFRWYGIGAGLILLTAALLLREPPGAQGSHPETGGRTARLNGPFTLSLLGMFAGTFAGLLIIGNLTPIVLQAGLTEVQAALAVSLFAVGNGAGRMVWGKLFDQWHYPCIPWSLGAFALAAGFLLLPLPAGMLLASVVLAGFCFGANFVVYASAISRHYGVHEFPRLYPVCFMAYGIAGVTGPWLGGTLADHTGNYQAAIVICVVAAAAAAAATTWKLNAFHHQPETPQGVVA